MSTVNPPTDLDSLVRMALEEDIGTGDITAQLINADMCVSGSIIAREAAILCGIPWANEVFKQLSADIELQWNCPEGHETTANEEIASISGNARHILSGERCALNFLQTLSGTATQTRRLVRLVEHTKVSLLDTRKTLPGLRSAQKYAVRVGGGQNHRMGLYDAFLIKENHIVSCGSIEQAIMQARKLQPQKTVEIEVQSLDELDQALAAGADVVMLDNFDLATTASAVKRNQGRAKLEASGGIDEQALVSIAETGVDYISIGALTKHCRAVDLSLLINE